MAPIGAAIAWRSRDRLRQITARHRPLACEHEHLGAEKFAVTAGGAVGWQDAIVHPALDRAHADAESSRGLHRAQIRRTVTDSHISRS